jgi:TolA-binding protein
VCWKNCWRRVGNYLITASAESAVSESGVGEDVIERLVWMTVQLEQSPFLSLVADERIQKTLALMGQAPDARLTPALARDVCERTGSAAVLDGSIAVEKHDAPLAEVTTPSLEALKAYNAGWKVISSNGSASGVPFFKRAIEIDPKFAVAYAWLGQLYSDIGESTLSAENISKAYQRRDRASDAEKLFITASYEMWVTGNLDKAQQTYELWVEAYPRAMAPHGFFVRD